MDVTDLVVALRNLDHESAHKLLQQGRLKVGHQHAKAAGGNDVSGTRGQGVEGGAGQGVEGGAGQRVEGGMTEEGRNSCTI